MLHSKGGIYYLIVLSYNMLHFFFLKRKKKKEKWVRVGWHKIGGWWVNEEKS